MENARVCELIKQVRNECLKKGQGGIKHLGAIFRAMDCDFSKRLCFEEFKKGVKMFGLAITNEDLKLLFDAFDKDKNNHIDFAELVAKLRPSMPKSRSDVIQEAFDALDVIKDNEIKMDDLKSKENSFICHEIKNFINILYFVNDFVSGLPYDYLFRFLRIDTTPASQENSYRLFKRAPCIKQVFWLPSEAKK